MNVQQTLRTLFGLPPRQSILITGPHGIGKSQVVRQAAEMLSIIRGRPHEFIDIRLSQREVGDIIGMPRRVDEFDVVKSLYVDGKMSMITETVRNVSVNDIPVWFPQDPNSCGFLFMDELDRATSDVQQAAFEAVLDYRMNLHEIPIGWLIVSAINADDVRYQVHQFDPALLDRFLVIKFNPTVPEWETWAACKEESVTFQTRTVVEVDVRPVHDVVLKYISKMGTTALDTPQGELEPMKVYPSRRSWEKLSTTIKFFAANGDDLFKDLNYLNLLAQGYVGTEQAAEFIEFIKHDYKVFTPTDILNKWNDAMEEDFSKLLVPEIAFYTKELVKHLDEKKVKLTKKQSENLKRFYFCIPKESASDFWLAFTTTCRDEATKWYRGDKEVMELTMALIKKSAALGRAEEEAKKKEGA